MNRFRGLIISKSLSRMTTNQIRFKSTIPATAATAAPPISTLDSKTELLEVRQQRKVLEKQQKKEIEAEKQKIVSETLFKSLTKESQDSLAAMGIQSLFPVQSATLEACRNGEDLVVRSKTGSGKTIAFALPTVEKLQEKGKSKTRGSPRCMVLAPTRELAIQIHREFEKLAPYLSCVAVYGGASVGGQSNQLRGFVDVCIGTPGRVQDFLERGELKLDQVQIAILDEADEMMRIGGFYEDIQNIYSSMPERNKRQNLLFSATMPRQVRTICDEFMNNPKFIDLVGDDVSKIPDTVEMCVTSIDDKSKAAALSTVLAAYTFGSEKENPKRALVFCTTKRECEELSRSFISENAISSGGALHGDMDQSGREQVLEKFRNGTLNVLVATDVAARGLDIPQVDLVVHYSLPRDSMSFVHRSGRTGRAGRKGTNVLFYNPLTEAGDIRDLERSVGIKFVRRAIPGGPDVVKRQGEIVGGNLPKSGSMINWLKAVADDLRKKDAEEGTDSLAAALATIMGSGSRMRTFSALNGRSGNQTIKMKRVDNSDILNTDIKLEELNSFLRGLPAFTASPTKSLVRDLHRVPKQGAVMIDVPEDYIEDVLKNAQSAGFVAEIVEGVLPESIRDFQESRPLFNKSNDSRSNNQRKNNNNGGYFRGGGGGSRNGGGGGGGGGKFRTGYGGGGDKNRRNSRNYE